MLWCALAGQRQASIIFDGVRLIFYVLEHFHFRSDFLTSRGHGGSLGGGCRSDCKLQATENEQRISFLFFTALTVPSSEVS